MESEGSVPDAHEVAGALRVAVGLVVRKLRQALVRGRADPRRVLGAVAPERGGPATSSDLARDDRISPQSMGVTVAALLDRGLIERDATRRTAGGSCCRSPRRGGANPRQARRAHRADRRGAAATGSVTTSWPASSRRRPARAAGGEALMGARTRPRRRRQAGEPPKPDAYAWVALANTTAAIFMASLDGSVVIIALPAIFRGINLDPLSRGQHQLPALDDHGLPPRSGGPRGQPGKARRHVRPGEDVQRGVRGVHDRLHPAVVRPLPRRPRGDVADRLADPAGDRRLDADGQLGGDPHRRVPGRAARVRPRHQSIAALAACSSAWWPAACSLPGTGARCSGSTSPSACSARCGPT